MPKKLDITGQRFGKLIVQEYVYSKNHRSYWKCICDCGCETIRMGHSLKTGNTQSCGCIHRELVKSYNGEKNPFYGQKHSTTTRKKISQIFKDNGHPWCGRKHSIESKIKMSKTRKGKGFLEDNHNWKGGIAKPSRTVGVRVEYKLWRESVLKRDGFTCRECSKKDKNMHTHHIWRWLKYPSIRYELWNGITLCKECHRKIYKKENEFAFNFMIKNRMLEVN